MNKIQISQKRLDKGLYWSRAWSLINGCTKVSEGCENCWAESLDKRFGLMTDRQTGKWNGEIDLKQDNLDLPLKVKKPTVWAIWNDLFHEDVSEDFIKEALEIMINSSQHIFLLLTKRPSYMKLIFEWLTKSIPFESRPHIWLGVTAENQKRADERIPILLDIPAKIKFVSIEPILERMHISHYLWRYGKYSPFINWIIVGAESGPNKRYCDTEWVRDVNSQRQGTGTTLFIKQLHINGKLVKDMNKFPEDLRIREMPIGWGID